MRLRAIGVGAAVLALMSTGCSATLSQSTASPAPDGSKTVTVVAII